LRPSTLLALAIGFAIAALLLPLLVFAVEVAQNPALLEVRVNVVLNQSRATLNVTLTYVGTVALTDARLTIGNRSTDLGSLSKGVTKIVAIPLSVGEALSLRPSDVSLRFKIMDLYSVEVRAAG